MEHIKKAITPAFISKILNEPVTSINITKGSNPGDNYWCVIYSIEATLKNNGSSKRNLILKAYPSSNARQQMLQMTNVFQKEFVVYDTWFPKYRKLQEELGNSSVIRLPVPPYLAGNAVDHDKNGMQQDETKGAAANTYKPNVLDNYILMEDVRPLGYKMADRIQGLDADHCKLVLRELGFIHALSWVYKKKNGIDRLVPKYPYLEDSMMSKTELADSFQSLVNMIVGAAKKMLEETLGVGSIVYQNFVNFFKHDTSDIVRWYASSDGVEMDRVEELLRVKTQFPKGYVKDPWLVLAHGDCWVNNFLFRYGEGVEEFNSICTKPTEIMFVDFQLFRESCPTTDLAYFMLTSTTRRTREEHLDEFLQTYHDSFLDTCSKFGFPPLPGFSVENLKIRFRQSKIYGLVISLPLLFVVLKKAERAQDLDQQEYDNIGEIFENGLGVNDENVILRERLKELVQDFYDDGIL